MVGRYPFLGGKYVLNLIVWLCGSSYFSIVRFSIMFYAITKKIIQGAVSFIIMVIAFGFAFFVISYDSEGDKFDNPGKSLLQIIVMILGEFEFNDLYQDSYKEDLLTLVFTMILLIGLIVFGSLIMANLIVAIIVSDVNMLAIAAKEQVLINKVCIFISIDY